MDNLKPVQSSTVLYHSSVANHIYIYIYRCILLFTPMSARVKHEELELKTILLHDVYLALVIVACQPWRPIGAPSSSAVWYVHQRELTE